MVPDQTRCLLTSPPHGRWDLWDVTDVGSIGSTLVTFRLCPPFRVNKREEKKNKAGCANGSLSPLFLSPFRPSLSAHYLIPIDNSRFSFQQLIIQLATSQTSCISGPSRPCPLITYLTYLTKCSPRSSSISPSPVPLSVRPSRSALL